MADAQSPQDGLDAVALWRALRNLLKVDVTVVGSEPYEDKTPVTLRVAATNMAPMDPAWPEIVFEEVRVIINGGGSGTAYGAPALRSGQSFTREYPCLFQQLAALDVRVESTLSRRSFFHVQQLATVPVAYTKSTAQAVLRKFNDIVIHAPLDAVIVTAKSQRGLSRDTTVAELLALSAALDKRIAEIHEAQERLKRMPAGMLGQQGRTDLEVAYRYLTRVDAVCRDMREAVSFTNAEKFATGVKALQGLIAEAVEVNRATEAAMGRYGIADEEANYKYRAWPQK